MSLLAQNIVNESEEPCAEKIWFDEKNIHVLLVDGRCLSVPLDFYPLLCNVSIDVLQDFEIFGEGTAIYFKELDEYLSIEGLVNGRKQMPRLEQLKK